MPDLPEGGARLLLAGAPSSGAPQKGPIPRLGKRAFVHALPQLVRYCVPHFSGSQSRFVWQPQFTNATYFALELGLE